MHHPVTHRHVMRLHNCLRKCIGGLPQLDNPPFFALQEPFSRAKRRANRLGQLLLIARFFNQSRNNPSSTDRHQWHERLWQT